MDQQSPSVAPTSLDVRRALIGNEPWLSKRELSHFLCFSVRWIEYRVAEGMPHKVIGGRLRFKRSLVEAWLDEREGAGVRNERADDRHRLA